MNSCFLFLNCIKYLRKRHQHTCMHLCCEMSAQNLTWQIIYLNLPLAETSGDYGIKEVTISEHDD